MNTDIFGYDGEQEVDFMYERPIQEVKEDEESSGSDDGVTGDADAG